MRALIKVVAYLGIVIIVLLVSLFSESISNPGDYARITDVDYTAVVVDEPSGMGKVIITERLTFDVRAASEINLFWELWRDLPEQYVDGAKVEYKVNSVEQILPDGTHYQYEESPKLYWDDLDYISETLGYGPGKWYHSEGPYNEDLRQYECVLFYVDALYRETVVFEIEYEMYNASLRYNDCSELYLSLYSGSAVKHLKSFKGQILVPNEIMPETGNYDAHTYGTNSNVFPITESDSANPGYHTFSFNLEEAQLKFRPYNQYIEFTLVSHGEDRHIFTLYASLNDYYYDDVLSEIKNEQLKYDAQPGRYLFYKIIVFVLLTLGTFLIMRYSLKMNKSIRNRYQFYEPEMEVEYFRDIPAELDPSFAAALAFCKHKSAVTIQDGYAAIMLSLARKGYIELVGTDSLKIQKPGNVRIVLKYNLKNPWREEKTEEMKLCGKCGKYNPVDSTACNSCKEPFPENDFLPLTAIEELYFNLIRRHLKGTEILMSKFQERIAADFEYTDSFVKKIRKEITHIGVSDGYFQKADYSQPKKQVRRRSIAFGILGTIVLIFCNLISYQTRLDLAFGAFFILGAGLMVSSIYLFRTAKKHILLTQFGEDEYAKWRGLYRFLDGETLMNERTVIELIIWEQYLIYATAFGISDKVIRALEIRCPEMEQSPILSNPYYRSRGFYISGRSFRSSTRSASFTARSGGHGGYGGGGRGGGGGGGGH